MHYDPGSDPDMVAGERPPEQALKALEMEPGTRHEGSIRSLLENSKDVEIVSLILTPVQVIIFDYSSFAHFIMATQSNQ